LLNEARGHLKYNKEDNEMYLRMVEKLSCEDPEKIDNFPHDNPYIQKIEVEI
jgi:hypothetical protein